MCTKGSFAQCLVRGHVHVFGCFNENIERHLRQLGAEYKEQYARHKARLSKRVYGLPALPHHTMALIKLAAVPLSGVWCSVTVAEMLSLDTTSRLVPPAVMIIGNEPLTLWIDLAIVPCTTLQNTLFK
jgi:hypothetical protein